MEEREAKGRRNAWAKTFCHPPGHHPWEKAGASELRLDLDRAQPRCRLPSVTGLGSHPLAQRSLPACYNLLVANMMLSPSGGSRSSLQSHERLFWENKITCDTPCRFEVPFPTPLSNLHHLNELLSQESCWGHWYSRTSKEARNSSWEPLTHPCLGWILKSWARAEVCGLV